MNRTSSLNILRKFIGSPEQYPHDKRSFLAIALFTLLLLSIFVFVDFSLGLVLLGKVLMVTGVILIGLIYLAKVLDRHQLAANLFAIVSYFLIGFSFFLNSGIEGPVLYLFQLSFVMIMVITRPHFHFYYLIVHLLVTSGIMYLEAYHPELAPYSYQNRQQQLLDILLCLTSSLIFTYLVIRYLRQSYLTEQQRVAVREEELARQTNAISAMNADLLQANREKDRLFSIIGHDLRTPIGSMRSYLEVLSEEKLAEDDRATIHKDLLNLSNHTYLLLDNLLHWSQKDVLMDEAPLKSLAIRPIVIDCKALLSAAAEEKQLSIEMEVPEELMVMANREMLAVVVRNLLSNAVKFTAPGGKISIRGVQKDDQVLLSVDDTGVGIPAQQMDKLFGNNRKSTYGTRQESGVGLGLVLCNEYIQAMGGHIQVESVEGEGTCFRLHLRKA